MNDIYNCEDYILYRKTPNIIVSYILVLIILIIFFIFVGNIKFKKYKKFRALYHNNSFYFETDIIYDLKELYINGKEYPYTVLSIDNNDENYLVRISSDLSSEWFVNDNYFDICFVYQETSVLKEVFKKYGNGD